MFQFFSSWFQDDAEGSDDEKEMDKTKKQEESREDLDTDLEKDKKKYRSKPLFMGTTNNSKIKRVKKSVRFTGSTNTKTKKRNRY